MESNSATDADEGVNSALRYSIIGGNSQNHFSIDSLTGEVSLIKSVDYESTRSFRLNIRAIGKPKPIFYFQIQINRLKLKPFINFHERQFCGYCTWRFFD